MDGHSGHRGRNGRSLAYDSSFILEPWRRGEDVVTSVDALERHRTAGIEYWLRVVPPFTPVARNRKERKIVERDAVLTEEYQALIGTLTLGQGDVHHRIYGVEQHRRLLTVDEGEHAQRLNGWVEEHTKWLEQAFRDFPLLRRSPFAGGLDRRSGPTIPDQRHSDLDRCSCVRPARRWVVSFRAGGR